MEVFPDSAIAEAVTALQNGFTVACATETCYGFACDLQNPDAVSRLFAIKQRPGSQPVSALFASLEQAKEYVEWNESAEHYAKHFPGPITIILKIREDAPQKLFPTPGSLSSTIGIRISSHPIAQKLVEEHGSPLSTTSANIHGKPNPYSTEDIENQFQNCDQKPDLLLNSGILTQKLPSTVIDLTENEMKILRQGSTALE